MSLFNLAAIFFVGLLLTILATGALLPWLRQRAMFDKPNLRSSHSTPTLHGGGLAVVSVVILLFMIVSINPLEWPINPTSHTSRWLVLTTIILAAISWLDDVSGVSPLLRLVIHFFVVGIIFHVDPGKGLIFQGIVPFWMDRVLAAVLWVWFLNLFNFMDGIDGITGLETASVGIGLIFLGIAIGWNPTGQIHAVVLTGVGIGFLWWNWPPAKIFLGDVGSVPLGFLLGWLLLCLAADGYWIPALILPLYYLADATLTVVRRLSQGKKVWEAHHEHYYQQAVGKGISHARAVCSIALVNAFLISFALTSLRAPVTGLIGATAVVFILLLYFKSSKDV